ncbi:MAG: YdcF family protein [Nanoarchaeota archaeon]
MNFDRNVYKLWLKESFGGLLMIDTAIILSYNREPDGSFGEEYRSLLDFGINLYFSKIVSSLTMSGKHGNKEGEFDTTQAEDMKDYAVEMGVPEKDVFVEDNSIDTVGQAVFSYRDIVTHSKIKSAIIVVFDYHLTRAAAIFDFVFGDKIRKTYAPIPTELIRNPDIRAAQEESLVAFLGTFDGVERGNLEAIQDRLFEKHRLYVGKREEFGG